MNTGYTVVKTRGAVRNDKILGLLFTKQHNLRLFQILRTAE